MCSSGLCMSGLLPSSPTSPTILPLLTHFNCTHFLPAPSATSFLLHCLCTYYLHLESLILGFWLPNHFLYGRFLLIYHCLQKVLPKHSPKAETSPSTLHKPPYFLMLPPKYYWEFLLRSRITDSFFPTLYTFSFLLVSRAFKILELLHLTFPSDSLSLRV